MADDPIPLEELARKLEQADDMLRALCHGEVHWKMSIPADLEGDSDLVLGRGLHAGEQAIDRLRLLAERHKPKEHYEQWPEVKLIKVCSCGHPLPCPEAEILAGRQP